MRSGASLAPGHVFADFVQSFADFVQSGTQNRRRRRIEHDGPPRLLYRNRSSIKFKNVKKYRKAYIPGWDWQEPKCISQNALALAVGLRLLPGAALHARHRLPGSLASSLSSP